MIKLPKPNIDRYISIMRWARWRYTKDGVLTLRIGYEPSRFMRIEYLAARRYLLSIGFTHGRRAYK